MAAGDIEVRIDRTKFRRFIATDRQVELSFKQRAEKVAARAKTLAPQDSGDLVRSIKVRQRRDAGGRFAPNFDVIADAPYAIYVHEGTAPHRIEGNPLLAFFWDRVGADVVLPYVNHPGTAPQPFLRDALRVV